MNDVSHVLSLILKTCENPNSEDAQIKDISLATRHPSHQSKILRHRIQRSDHRLL